MCPKMSHLYGGMLAQKGDNENVPVICPIDVEIPGNITMKIKLTHYMGAVLHMDRLLYLVILEHLPANTDLYG